MDYSTAVCDAQGWVVAQGLTLPIQLCSFPRVMRFVRERFGNELAEGDVLIANDPYGSGGQHLPDIYVLNRSLRRVRLRASRPRWGTIPTSAASCPAQPECADALRNRALNALALCIEALAFLAPHRARAAVRASCSLTACAAQLGRASIAIGRVGADADMVPDRLVLVFAPVPAIMVFWTAMEHRPTAQRQPPKRAVGLHRVPGHHLRVRAGDVVSRDDRVQQRQVGVGRKLQRGCGSGLNDGRHGQGGRA